MLRKDVQNVPRKAAMQLHIRTQSGASPSRIEGLREFEADLSALFFPLQKARFLWNYLILYCRIKEMIVMDHREVSE